MFFSFDGIDGVGKTTQLELFVQWLSLSGRRVLSCRDPGTTELGETLRGVVLERHHIPIHPLSEMLIYMAARAQLVQEVVLPALRAGHTVVSDRFLLANLVYQGYAGGLNVEQVRTVGAVATADVVPDLTFLLDMPVDQAALRIDRSLDRMEARGTDYLTQVRAGFLQEAERSPDSIVVIDATQEIAAVQAQIQMAAQRVLGA